MTNPETPPLPKTALLQPHPLTSVMQLSVTAAGLCVAAAAAVFAVKSASDERNARLVEIGVSVLRVDPAKEKQVSAARGWALDLIDANAGGVKFSKEARSELLQGPLDIRELKDATEAIERNLEANRKALDSLIEEFNKKLPPESKQ
jgi:hypothetical protein